MHIPLTGSQTLSARLAQTHTNYNCLLFFCLARTLVIGFQKGAEEEEAAEAAATEKILKYYCILRQQQQQCQQQRSAATTTNNSSNNNNTVELSSVRSLWHSPALTRERRAPTIPFIHGPARSRARQRSSDEEEGKQNYLRFILIHSLWMRGAFYVSGKSRRRASSAMQVCACVCVRE